MNNVAGDKSFNGRRAALWGLSAPRIILGATLVGLLIRLMNLGGKSLWLDEAFNIAVVKAGLKALWTQTFETHHPPLHFFLQKLWMQGGTGEFWLRLLPALCGAAAVPLIYAFGKKVAGKNAALTAAGLVSLSPLLVWYSQDFRPYSFVVALGLAAMTAAVHLFMKPSLPAALAFLVAMIASFYTHYGMFLLIPLQILLILFMKAERKLGKGAFLYWVFSLAVAGAAFYPWLKTPAAHAFWNTLKTGSYPGKMLAKTLGVGTPTLALILAVAAYLGGMVGLYAVRSLMVRADTGKSEDGRAGHGGRLVDIAVYVFLLAILIGSVIPRGYSFKKQILILVPLAMLVIGRLWPWRESNRKKIGIAFALSLVFSLANVFAVPKDEWKQAVSFLNEEYRAGDAVFLLPSYGSFPFEYYNRGKLPGEGIDIGAYAGKIEAALSSGGRIWLVTNREAEVDPEGRIRETLNKRSACKLTKRLYRVRLDRFDNK